MFRLNVRLSIVIPTLNAAETLASCLARLDGAQEIIVVDGGSTDETPHIARRHGADVVSSTPGRGVQLRAGGHVASGDWLLFIHADTLLGSDWLRAADRHIATAPDAAGHFGFRLQSDAWQAQLIEAGVRLRVRLFGLPYGDQALLIGRDLYDRVGGYKSLPLFEDVDLIRRLGRQRLRLLQADALTSAARWQQEGWFARSARNMACLGLYLAGVSPEFLALFYGGTESTGRKEPAPPAGDLSVG